MVEPYVAFVGLAAAAGFAIAGLVFLARPARAQNRLLASALFFEGVAHVGIVLLNVGTVGLAGASAVPVSDPGLAQGGGALIWLGVSALPFAYLAFLGTVDTPLASPLDTRKARLALGGGLLAAWTLRLVSPSSTIHYVEGGIRHLTGIEPLASLFTGLVSLFGLVVAISYWRRTEPGTLRRKQAGAFVAAFGARDTLWVINALMHPPIGLGPEQVLVLDQVLFLWLTPLAAVLFALLAAYGILTTQLFDVDLKLKLGIEKSTLVGAFGVAFLVASEVAEELAGVDGTLYGIGAAVAIGLFFRRIERGAEHVAERLMPGVEDTPEYRAERKREIYRAQLEELMADDQVTAKERSALLRLQEDLGLGAEAANRIEGDVIDGSAGGEA